MNAARAYLRAAEEPDHESIVSSLWDFVRDAPSFRSVGINTVKAARTKYRSSALKRSLLTLGAATAAVLIPEWGIHALAIGDAADVVFASSLELLSVMFTGGAAAGAAKALSYSHNATSELKDRKRLAKGLDRRPHHVDNKRSIAYQSRLGDELLRLLNVASNEDPQTLALEVVRRAYVQERSTPINGGEFTVIATERSGSVAEPPTRSPSEGGRGL